MNEGFAEQSSRRALTRKTLDVCASMTSSGNQDCVADTRKLERHLLLVGCENLWSISQPHTPSHTHRDRTPGDAEAIAPRPGRAQAGITARITPQRTASPNISVSLLALDALQERPLGLWKRAGGVCNRQPPGTSKVPPPH